MATIYLVRHGKYNFDDGSLSLVGENQARRAGQMVLEDLKGKDFKVLSSPKKRAIETASIAFGGKEIEVDERFDDPSPLTKEEWDKLPNPEGVLVIVTHMPMITRILDSHHCNYFINDGDVFKIEGKNISRL